MEGRKDWKLSNGKEWGGGRGEGGGVEGGRGGRRGDGGGASPFPCVASVY